MACEEPAAAIGSGDEGYQRLHPLSWLFQLAAQLRSLLIPAILYLVAGEGSRLRFLLLLFMVPALLQPILHYLTYRYRLGAEEMVVREGVLFRNERRIHYGRIQNVDLVQNPLHRLFGVALVRVETASGSKPEALMRVLSLSAVERLRRQIRTDAGALRDRPHPPRDDAGATSAGSAAGAGAHGAAAAVPGIRLAEESPPITLLELPAAELVKIGLISNRGWVVVGAALALLWQQDFISWETVDWEGLGAWLPFVVVDSASSLDLAGSIVIASVVVLLAALILYALSIGLAFQRFYGFRLERRGDHLRSELGLLTRHAMTTPRNRIQRLIVQRTPLHRLFRRASIRIETAGGAGDSGGRGEGGGSTEKGWLSPIVDVDQTESLIAEAIPEVSMPPASWQPIARRAWRRLFRVGIASLLLLTLGLSLLSLWALVLLALGGPWVALAARRYVQHRHYALTDQALLWRAGWWTRELTVVRYSKIQAVLLTQSPFDRRAGTASVQVDTAGGSPVWHGVDIPFLELEVAREMAVRLHHETAGRRFEWR